MNHSKSRSIDNSVSASSGNSETRRAALAELYSPNRWCRFCFDFILIMDEDAALLLSQLINVSEMVHAEKADGWFYHTTEQIEERTYLPKWRQDRVIAKLTRGRVLKNKDGEEVKRIPWITVERRGWPAKRYIKIEYENIHRSIRKAKKKRERMLTEKLNGKQDAPSRCLIEATEEATVASKSLRPVASITKQLDAALSQQLPSKKESEEKETKKHSRTASSGVADATPSSPATVVVGGMFKTDVSKRSVAEQKSTTLAAELKKGIVRKNKLMRKADLKKWSVALLRFAETSLESGLDEMEPVLMWYKDHVAEPMMPEAFSAQTFCDKWDQIRAAYDRRDTPQKPSNKPPAPLPAQLSDDEKLILKLLEPLDWPKGAKRHVADAARRSHSFYRPLFHAIYTYQEKIPHYENGRVNSSVAFARAFVNMMPRPVDFTVNYYSAFHESVADWKDWSGKLPVASMTDKRFLDFVYEFAEEWSGDPKVWDDLMEKVRPYMEG